MLRAWLEGAYELVVSPSLLREVERVLDYPQIPDRVTPREAEELLDLLPRQAESDDYLISLAQTARAVIVSGDAHLLRAAEQIPVITHAAFQALLTDEDREGDQWSWVHTPPERAGLARRYHDPDEHGDEAGENGISTFRLGGGRHHRRPCGYLRTGRPTAIGIPGHLRLLPVVA